MRNENVYFSLIGPYSIIPVVWRRVMTYMGVLHLHVGNRNRIQVQELHRYRCITPTYVNTRRRFVLMFFGDSFLLTYGLFVILYRYNHAATNPTNDMDRYLSSQIMLAPNLEFCKHFF